ncbi:MAG: c-type cytochrome [Litoreibacter sp.]|nr:c-type cytochrome [Litoreibacter sp.]
MSLSISVGAQAQEFTTLKGHGGPIMGLAVSPEGQVASASFDNSLGLWTDGVPEWLEGHDAAVISLNYSQAPALISGSDDFRVLLWHPALDRPFELTKHQGKVAGIAYDAESGRIATASWDGSLRLMELLGTLATPGLVLTRELLGHRSNVTDVRFAPGGGLLSTSSDGTIRAWEGPWDNPSSRVLVTHGFGINKLIVGGDWIAYGAVDGGTRVMTLDGEEIADFTLDRRPILAMAYHEDTGQLAVGDGHGFIMMIDTNEWRITRDFRAARQGPVWALAFSPDGKTIYAGGLDDVIYAWPVASLTEFEPGISGDRSFLREAATMPNGERQFMRKCSICHTLEAGPSRKAGPTLHKVFGRRAGTVPGYLYSDTLDGSEIIWSGETIDALFDEGPDHYIPGSKMPMQVIAGAQDRADLIAFLRDATRGE